MTAPVVTVLVGAGYATDISSQVHLPSGVSIARGRADEFSEVQPSTLSLTIDISVSPLPAAVVVGAPLRVQVTANSVTTNRFSGFVESVQTTWTKGARTSAVSVTAVDAHASLNRRRLRSVLTQTALATSPACYWPLDEVEGATSAGDQSGNGWPPLSLAQRGSGGTFAMGSGAGPVTEGNQASATFTRASATAGPYLTATLPRALQVTPGPFDWGMTFSFVVSSSTVATQSFLRFRRPDIEKQDGTPLLEVGCNASGMLTFNSAFMAGFTNTTTTMVCDGLPHHIFILFGAQTTGNATQDTIAAAYVDGVDANLTTGVITYQTTPWPGITQVDLGGSTSTGSSMCSASISRLTVWERWLSNAERDRLLAAATTGFTADRSDERIARYADWAGVTNRSLETGSLTVAHQDTEGMSPFAAMQVVAATERGLVFINGSGQLVFHARTHRYAPSATALVDTDAVDDTMTFTTDTQQLINKATVSRPGGAAQTFLDAASITAYDEFGTEVELLTTSDDDAAQAAAWLVNLNSQPRPRISTVGVDLLTLNAIWTGQIQALELGSMLSITGLPSQAPASGVSLFVEGWTEDISLDGWQMTLNTSPLDAPLVLDGAFGALDSWRLV